MNLLRRGSNGYHTTHIETERPVSSMTDLQKDCCGPDDHHHRYTELNHNQNLPWDRSAAPCFEHALQRTDGTDAGQEQSRIAASQNSDHETCCNDADPHERLAPWQNHILLGQAIEQRQ